MWDFDECRRRRRGCKSGILVDRVAMKTSCSECGLDYGLGDCGLSSVTTDPNNPFSSSDDTHGDSQRRGSDTVTSETKNSSDRRGSNSLAAEPNNDSSDDLLADGQGDLQNRVSIASMSDSLGLPPNVKNQANEIFQKVENKSREKDRNVRIAFFAACIYVACRQEDGMTRSIREICSVSNGATVPNVAKATGVIADTLNMDKNWLMQIKATDLIKRFCSNLGMVGQAVEAAQEAAKSSESVERHTHVSVAAGVVYVVAQLYNDKLLLEDITKATGVPTITITRTYRALYPHLSTIIPKWFAREDDLKKLPRP
ncbi:unnamed protein product [Microthlaspi erraticum]|uniref:Transcription factor TFIIB cyclin-like domain-containing protein n=1 Tax=Microthlaspi erraticum TaxID=1685480 RepID=A0A6D2LKM6_9BRAS|nr:unnamed protein product [Microthlaspi erraticum]